jgi:hypothetical protein
VRGRLEGDGLWGEAGFDVWVFNLRGG